VNQPVRFPETRRKHLPAGVAAVCILLLPSACHKPRLAVTQTESTPPEALVDTPFDPTVPVPYVLYPGDRLLVRFPTDSTFDQELRIRSDGMITLPYAGDVEAARRPPTELATELNERYAGVLNDPQIAVIVLEEEGRRVYVGGQVQVPGALALRPNSTLVQALYESGGATSEANVEQVIVLRNRPGEGTYVLAANLKRILAGQDPDVRLHPFDIVHVPETIIAQVDRFVQQYVNMIIPQAVAFPFTTEIHNEPVRVIGTQSGFTPVEITR